MKVGYKIYLGDSVYAQYDGERIILTTENGLPGDPSNTIFMEPEVLEALDNFHMQIIEWVKSQNTA